MAAESSQISPSGDYNSIGVDFLSPKTTSQNIVVKDAPAGNKILEIDVTNRKLLLDTLIELTTDAGITAEGVKFEDGDVNAATISGACIGTSVQAQNTALQEISGLTLSENDFIVKGASALLGKTPAQVLSIIGAAAASHTHDASVLISGTLADARVAGSNVTQHINDAGTGATDFFSAQKILATFAQLGANADITSLTALEKLSWTPTITASGFQTPTWDTNHPAIAVALRLGNTIAICLSGHFDLSGTASSGTALRIAKPSGLQAADSFLPVYLRNPDNSSERDSYVSIDGSYILITPKDGLGIPSGTWGRLGFVLIGDYA